MAREHGFAIDRDGFDAEMNQQRERARASWKGAEKGVLFPRTRSYRTRPHQILGYSELDFDSRVSSGCWWIKQLVEPFPPARR